MGINKRLYFKQLGRWRLEVIWLFLHFITKGKKRNLLNIPSFFFHSFTLLQCGYVGIHVGRLINFLWIVSNFFLSFSSATIHSTATYIIIHTFTNDWRNKYNLLYEKRGDKHCMILFNIFHM